MPVRVTEVALQQLALVATRKPTLCTQYGLLVTIKHLCIIGFLIAITAVLCTVVVLVSNHATRRVRLTVGTS
jgi:hypothetical protein